MIPRADQRRISVPLVGPPVAPNFGFELGNLLVDRWLGFPTASTDRLTAIATHIEPSPQGTRLILLLTFDRPPAGAPIDNPRIARELNLALDNVQRKVSRRSSP